MSLIIYSLFSHAKPFEKRTFLRNYMLSISSHAGNDFNLTTNKNNAGIRLPLWAPLFIVMSGSSARRTGRRLPSYPPNEGIRLRNKFIAVSVINH